MDKIMLSLPVLELSYVEMIVYSDGFGNFHLSAHYLFGIDGNDELVGQFNGRKDHIAQLPHILPETEVRVRMDNAGTTLETIQFQDVPEDGVYLPAVVPTDPTPSN